MRHTRQSGANILNKTGIPRAEFIEHLRTKRVHPAKLPIGVNVIRWIGEAAGAGRVARSEGVAVSQPIVLDVQAILAAGLVINSARRLFALEQVPDGLRLLPK